MDPQKIVSQEQLARDWLKYAVKDLIENLDEQKVGRISERLVNSFVEDILATNPDNVKSIFLRAEKYLRYLDMGVGRGVPAGSRASKVDYFKARNSKGQLLKYGRKKKPVYNKPITHQTKRLLELLAENFGIKAISTIENSLENNNGVDIKLGK